MTAADAIADGVRTHDKQHPIVMSGPTFVGGLHIGDTALTYRIGDGHYSVRLNAESRGFVRLLFDWAFELEASGTLQTESSPGVHPVDYQSRRRKRDDFVVRRVPFQAGTALVVPPEGIDPNPHPIPPDELKDVLDPASALLSAGLALAHTGTCDQVLRIFDGNTRNDVVLADYREPDPPSGNPDAGIPPEKRCVFESFRIAGFSELRQGKPTAKGEIWFRPYGETLLVPARLQVPTPVGTAVFHFHPPAG